MRTMKSVLGVIAVLVPVIYCGGLIYYFLDLTGSVREADAMGLGPTLIGLTVVGLLFCIPLIVKIVRIIIQPRSPGSGGGSGRDASTHDGKDGFDPDAAVARYLAQRSAEATSGSPATSAQEGEGQPTRSTFGRRVR